MATTAAMRQRLSAPKESELKQAVSSSEVEEVEEAEEADHEGPRYKENLCTRVTFGLFNCFMRNAPRLQSVQPREFSEATFIKAKDEFWGFAKEVMREDGEGADHVLADIAAPVALADPHGRAVWRFGPKQHAIMTTRPADVKELMVTNHSNLVLHDDTGSFVEALGGQTIFGMDFSTKPDSKWGLRRKMFKEIMHEMQLSKYFPSMQTILSRNFSAAVEAKEGMDVKRFANYITLDMIGHVMGLAKVAPGTKDKILDLVEFVMTELASHRNQTIKKYMPFLKYRPFSACFKPRMTLALQEGAEIIKNEILKPNAASILQGDNWLKRNKVTKDTLLSSDMVDIVKEFYIAGSETTGTFLEAFLIALADPAHQDQFEKLFAELESVAKKYQQHDVSQWPEEAFKKVNLPFLYSAAMEVLRLNSPIPDIVVTPKKKFNYAGGVVMPGDILNVSPRFVQTSEKVWGDDAKQFKYDRFYKLEQQKRALEEKGEVVPDDLAYKNFPFGFSPKICVGQGFAMKEVIMAMARAIYMYRFKLDKQLQHPYKAHQVYTRRIVTDGAKIYFEPRQLVADAKPQVEEGRRLGLG